MASKPRIFVVRAGKSGGDEEKVLESGEAFIGFTEIPSLRGLRDYDEIAALVAKHLPNKKPRAQGNIAGQLWAYALSMKEGDIVVLPRKRTAQIAIGRVTGEYQYKKIGEQFRHTRSVEWLRADVPRTAFGQDLLRSFGAFLTIYNVSRNDAAQRVAAILDGKPDPGAVDAAAAQTVADDPSEIDAESTDVNVEEVAHDRIVAHIQKNFPTHDLARLVEAVLRAEGWVTTLSPEGPDGGVDVLAGRGSLGLDAPRLCVQVKSQNSPTDVTTYRTLQGTMQSFKADQGLLVCWGGFNRNVRSEARQGHFTVRLWDSGDLIDAIYRNYERLPAEIQAEIPLKRVWALVDEAGDE